MIFLPMNIFIDAKLSLNMATLNKEIYIYGVHYNMACIFNSINHFVYSKISVTQIMRTTQFLSNSKRLSNLIRVTWIYRVSFFQEAKSEYTEYKFSILILFILSPPPPFRIVLWGKESTENKNFKLQNWLFGIIQLFSSLMGKHKPFQTSAFHWSEMQFLFLKSHWLRSSGWTSRNQA